MVNSHCHCHGHSGGTRNPRVMGMGIVKAIVKVIVTLVVMDNPHGHLFGHLTISL